MLKTNIDTTIEYLKNDLKSLGIDNAKVTFDGDLEYAWFIIEFDNWNDLNLYKVSSQPSKIVRLKCSALYKDDTV